MLQSAYTKKGLSGDRVAWNIVNNRGQLYTFDPVTLKVDDEADYKLYMINPNYLSSYLESIKNSFNKKFGITTIASSDLLTFIPTNYKGTQVSMSTGEEISMAAGKSLSDGMKLMLSNPGFRCLCIQQQLDRYSDTGQWNAYLGCIDSVYAVGS